MSLKNGYLAIALMSSLSLVACSNTAAGAKKDAEINKEKAEVAADKAGDKAAVAADEAKAKAEVASEEAKVKAEEAKAKADVATDKAQAKAHELAADTKDKARDAAGAIKGAKETIDVKTALMADRTVDASHINVDTFHETKTVVLKGSVKTAAQRDEAARIAAAEAPGYRIDNQLRVVANP